MHRCDYINYELSLLLAQCVSSIESLPKGCPAIEISSATSEGELDLMVNNFQEGSPCYYNNNK